MILRVGEMCTLWAARTHMWKSVFSNIARTYSTHAIGNEDAYEQIILIVKRQIRTYDVR